MVSRERMVALTGDGSDLDAILAGDASIPLGLAELLAGGDDGLVVEDLLKTSEYPSSTSAVDGILTAPNSS